MDEIYRKLIQNDDINGIGWYIDGKLCDHRDYEELLASSTTARDTWKINPCRGLILAKVAEKLMTKEKEFLKLASFSRSVREDFVQTDLKYLVLGLRYYSKLSNRRTLKLENSSNSGIFCGALLDRCPVLIVLTWLTAAPLAAGNSVVLLIQPIYSVFALYFATVLHEAGVPPGVLNVVPFVNGEHFNIAARYFSCISGIISKTLGIYERFSFSTVYVKNDSFGPILILKSADTDSAIECFFNLVQSEETLWFPNVIYVEETVYYKVSLSLKNVAIRYNSGGCKCDNDSEFQVALTEFLNKKRGQGYEILELKNEFSTCLIMVNCDYAVENPVLMDESGTVHRIVSLLPVRTVQEGISAVNNSETKGAAISLWSDNATDILSIPLILQYGTVWVNCAAFYSPLIPFSPSFSINYGTFSGKRAFYGNILKSDLSAKLKTNHSFQTGENMTSSLKHVSSLIKKCIAGQSWWCKLEQMERLNCLENFTVAAEKEWRDFRNTSTEVTKNTVWENAIRYMNFWLSYGIDCTCQEIVKTDHCRVICESQPLGIIGILVGKASLDEIVFLISAALVYGNGVIVGLSTDQKSFVSSAEIEKIFSSQLCLVTVIDNDTNSLWQHFLSEKNVASIWFMKNSCNLFSEKYFFKNIVPVESQEDMIELTEFFEIYGTKQKAVWFRDVHA